MMSDTFDGLNALIDTSPAPSEKPAGNSSAGDNFTVQMPDGGEFGVMPADPGAGFIAGQNGMPFPMSVSTLPDPAKPAPRDNTVRTDDIFSALPTMGLPDISPEDEAAASEAKWAENTSQAGQILSADDSVDASLGYVRSLGENLLNQQVNDWLNQVGHARVQLGSNKTGDADLLLPLIDNPNSLLFSQFGIRANDERTTTNLGLGYRQYEDGWMWGLNSFYDYDITGSNSRVGVGGELWADYVKLAANGYFRITDWHQSTLNEMRDYDERPANGFDVRAEGYLPDYPQLGAFVKYEQYFGDGVSLAGTTSSGELKSNPSVSTVGVSYTPFPLITFKGETSAGDSNDSKVGMELSYRFGVPLSQQLDTENVDLMRNLAGNRYDFVDRNYNIVMQYRKQELLRIGLPPALNGEAAQTLPVTASVLKAKYGLKSLRWSAPELEAQGGEIRQTGLTTVDITLPEYVFMTRNGAPQGYRVTAVGTDNEGNLSNTAEMWVNVIPSTETITKLTVTPNRSLLANNSDQFTAVALLQNDTGGVLANKAVTFSVSGLKNSEGVTIFDTDGNSGQTLTVITGADGTATVKIISKSAGKGLLKAKMRNGNSRTEAIVFIADSSTAKIKTLELTHNKALANGQEHNIALTTVTDQFDNPVENFTLNARADNGATVVNATAQTDESGRMTTQFSSETAGDSKLVVEGAGTSKSVTSQFIADISTAKIQSVVITQDNATADGKAKNRVLVTVTDNRNNPLAGAPVTITVPATARYQTQPVNGMTDSRGQLQVDITNTKAAQENYTFSINDSRETRQLTFKPDITTASIASLISDKNTIIADGTESATLTVTVKDAYSNIVPDNTVNLTTTLGTLSAQTVVTDNAGQATVTLTATRVGDAAVHAVNATDRTGKKVIVRVSPDSSTMAVKSVLLNGDKTTKVANGTDNFTYTALVQDANGNPIAGVTVTPAADNPDAVVLVAGTTNANGEVIITLAGTNKAMDNIIVSAATDSGVSVDADKAVSFIYNINTAKVSKVTLNGDLTQKIADGVSSFTYTAQLVDANNNPIRQADLDVKWTQDKGSDAVLSAVSSKTNADGQAVITLTSTTKVVDNIRVSGQFAGTIVVPADKTVSFTFDEASAKVSTVKLNGSVVQKVADGTSSFTYTAQLVDANNNPIRQADLDVKWTQDKGSDVVLSATTSKTDASGKATITLTSTKKATDDIGVSAQYENTAATAADKLVSFIFELNSAKVGTVALDGTIVQKVADGANTFTYTAQLVDSSNNPIRKAGLDIKWTQDKGTAVKLSAVSSKTDADGKAVITLTSTTTAVDDVRVSAQYLATATVPADKTVSFIYNINTVKVNKVALNGDLTQKIADGTSSFSYTAQLTDANNNPIRQADLVVNWTQDKGANVVLSAITSKTDADGKAVITLTSTTTAVDDVFVSAQYESTVKVAADKAVSFISDLTSTKVGTVTLSGAVVEKIADGVNNFTFTAQLVDANNNPIRKSGLDVKWTQDKGSDVVLSAVSSKTNTDGKATIVLTSTQKAVDNIRVSAQYADTAAVAADKTVNFIYNINLAKVGTVLLDGAVVQKIADGVSNYTFTAQLVDSNNNPIRQADLIVNWAQNKGSDAVLSAATSKTDANGKATITLTSTKKATDDITVSAKYKETADVPADKTVSFIYNINTVKVNTVTLDGNQTQKIADGTSSFTYTAQLTDANNNPIRQAGLDVKWTQDKGTDVALSAVSSKTNADGKAVITLTSTTTATDDVRVSGQYAQIAAVPADRTISFTYQLTSAKVGTVVLSGLVTEKIADGVNSFTYTAQLVDNNNNPIRQADLAVNWTQDKGADVVLSSATSKTDANGKATITLTSTKKAVDDIRVSAQYEETVKVAADKLVSFIFELSSTNVGTVKLDGAVVQKVADGTSNFTYTAQLVDSNNNPVRKADLVVNWTQDKGTAVKLSAATSKTDADGKAVITLTSTTTAVDDVRVNAQYLATAVVPADKMVSFTYQLSSAKVGTVLLDGAVVKKVADGVNSFTYTAQLVDTNNNPVRQADLVVNWTQDKGSDVVLSATTSKTNADGKATITLTSTKKAVDDIRVSAQYLTTTAVPADKTVSFIHDLTSAKVSTVKLDGAVVQKIADGVNSYTFTAQLVDDNNNPIHQADLDVKWTQDKGAAVTLSAATSKTDATGKATITLTSTTTAVDDVRVSAQYKETATVPADKAVSFIYNINTTKVNTVTLDGDLTQKIADGVNHFTYTAQLTDGNGNPIRQADLDVKWIQDKGTDVVLSATTSKTDAGGKATITLTSTKKAVDDVRVSAQYATSPVVPADTNVSFIYELSSAKVGTVTLDNGTVVQKIADGVNTFTYTAQLVDTNNNPIRKSGLDVKWMQDKGADVVLSATTSQTDANGKATITLTSTTKVVSDITVSAQYLATTTVAADKKVSFIYDLTSAKVSTVTLDNGMVVQKIADGVNTFTYTAQLVDTNNNPVTQADLDVKWTQDKGADVVLSATTSKTDATGKATITLTSTKKAVDDITVSGQYLATATVAADKKVSFIYDMASAKVGTVNLDGAVVQKIADGVNTFTYTAQLVDINNNPIRKADLDVKWTQDKGVDVVLSAVTSKTDATGKATITLTSTKKAVDGITVSAQYLETVNVASDKKVSFIYDLTSAKVSTVKLDGNVTEQIADGIKFYTYTAQLVDINNNPINQADLDVKWTQDKGADVVLSATTSKTDATGKATIKLTSTTKAVSDIQVSAQYLATTTVAADKKVSFIYDLASAKIGTVILDGAVVEKIADGINTFTYTAQLVDINNNPVTQADLDVKWTQDKGVDVVLSAATSKTDATGKTTITLKSTKKAVDDVIVSAQYLATVTVPADKKISFIADAATARISLVKLSGELTRKVANGTNTFIFVATVTDVNGNPVRNMDVTWSGNKPDTTTLVATAPKTGVDGTVEATLTSSLTPTYDIIVSAAIAGQNKVDANLKVSFEELFKGTITVVDAGKKGTVVIAGARIEIYSENKGEKLVDTTTPASGKVPVELVAGKYAIVITKDTYRTYDDFIEIRTGADLNYQFGLIQLGDNDAKIIVQWQENKPKDPDTYIKVPAGVNVYRGNKNYNNGEVTLDRDDTSASGLETITIKAFKQGTYTYALECYNCTWSNFNDTDAKVSVYINDRVTLGGGTSKDTYVTSPRNAVATTGNTTKFWRVLEINVTSAGVVTTKVINTYSTAF
ncbi:invasin-like inverse autotransporter protein [Morganella psychrotolerans]